MPLIDSEGGDGRVEHAFGQRHAAFRGLVPRGFQQVSIRLRAQVSELQFSLPRTCFFNCAACWGVSAWPERTRWSTWLRMASGRAKLMVLVLMVE
jgi:hypothetical protein